MHHDEGVNGLFMTALFRTGYYHYDPANYHGPTLYYFGLLTSTFNSVFYGKAGLSTFAVRLVPALFGIGIVWLLFGLRRQIGPVGAVTAALLIAVSPGAVFFSRYFIHEILFVFFTLGLLMAVVRYREAGLARSLILAAISAALLFATKETSVITFAVLILAFGFMRGLLYGKERLISRSVAANRAVHREVEARKPASANREQLKKWLPIAALVFIAVSVLFYSSFLTNFPQGVYDSLRTYKYWTKTSRTDDVHRWFTYLDWLVREEFPTLALGAIGTAIAFYKARHPFAIFSAFWALGMLCVYSYLPYKTPWLTLNIVLPLAIVAGYGVQQWYDRKDRKRASLAPTLAVIAICVAAAASLYQAIDLSFVRYDDDSIPYVYAHTRRNFVSLIDEVESVAARNQGTHTGIVVMAPEYWPLPWYLRDYPNAGYWGRVVPTSEPIVIASEPQSAEVDKTLGNSYRRYDTYDMRPGVRLVLYLRQDQRP